MAAMVKVRLPTPLRRLAGGKDVVEVTAVTLAECLSTLDKNYAGMKERLCDEKGELRPFVNIYINGEDVRFLKGLQTSLKEGDEVSIVPAVAGG